MLDEIREKLEAQFALPVYYGAPLPADGKRLYDYVVFWRDHRSFAPSTKGDYTDYYTIAVVRRDFVGEDDAANLLAVVSGIPGAKRSGDANYDYMVQPGTALALESVQLTFTRAGRTC